MTSLRVLVIVSGLAGVAHAQPADAPAPPAPPAPASAPDATPTLAVTLGQGPLAVDRPMLLSAIADELGVTLIENVPGSLGAIAIEFTASDRAVIRYLPPTGPELVRAVMLPVGDDDRRRLLAFVAGNLVRDQLGGLEPSSVVTPPYDAPIAATPAPVAAAAAPSGTAAPGAAASAPIVAPPVPSVPVIVVAPPSRTRVVRPDPEEGPRVPMSIGFIPPFATDRLWADDATVGAGVHALIGETANVRGVSVAGIVDINRRFMVGVQVAGIAAIDRDVLGISVGGIATIARQSRGAQIAGIAAISGPTHGLQVGGIATVAADARAIQVGGIATIARDLDGLQVGGIATAARDLDGLQVGGIATTARSVNGAQVAGIAAIADQVHGLQVGGVLAIGREVRGAQISVINVARHVHGLQLGVVNVSDDVDGAPIGLVNIVRNGPVMVDAWAESSGVTAAALRHGSRAFHTIYAVAAANDGDRTPLVGLGFGLERSLGRHALDIDALAWQTNLFDDNLGMLDQLRATVAIDVGAVDLLVGGAINVQIDDMGQARDVHAYLARDYHSSSGVEVSVFPTATIGARLHLHRPR
ncbi:MAG: hypothetical protein K8W52_27260 [Deltaproteobacteria bacterium]|nr:hypothetical protein [Deltaproteobacteria bacterium]